MQSIAIRSLEYCRQLTRRSGSNFFYSFLFLPKASREAIYAVYAFSRAVDDVVDEMEDASKATELLAGWRHEIKEMEEGRATHPITVQMGEASHAFGIPKELPLALIDGCEMDLRQCRYDTFEDLYDYCYHVASVIGLMCIEVFGYETEEAKRYAEKLGIAFQLTNILRDVKSDAERGRIYLPREDLDQFGYTEKDVLGSVYNENFISLMEFQCRRAERFYNEARDALASEDQPYMLAAEIMGGTYWQILREIEKVHYDVYNHRVFLPRFRKLWIALSIWASR